MRAQRVCLIGPRGAGKSTLGALLAQRLELPLLDVDAVVERETGRTVAELMAADVFRMEEARVLRKLLAEPRGVVATGGGAVLWDGFADAAVGWRVIWLDAPADVLAARIAAGPPRPSLTGADPEDEIAAVAAARAPLYEVVSWRRVDTSADDPETVVLQLENLLRDGNTDLSADE